MVEINSTPTADITQRQAALIAGIAYLMVFIVATLAGAFALDRLIVQGDANTTYHNIMANQSLFRLGLAGFLVVIVFDTIAAWGLYVFLRPVNKSISLTAAWFRLLFVAIFAVNLINHFSILPLVSPADYLKSFGIESLQAQMMQLINAQQTGVHISFMFFGIHILLIGYLIVKSDFIPRMLGIMLLVAAVGYQIDSFAFFLSADYANSKVGFIVAVAIPAITSEFSLTIWLLYKGLKRTEKSAE